ncbi:MAG: hypothetical protein H6Q37_1209, partial [Chloroflexi bacterium]|nr:hypothetical protein [Chloroflexota bacterium]
VIWVKLQALVCFGLGIAFAMVHTQARIWGGWFA